MIYFKKLLAINILFVLAISMSNSAWAFDKIHLQRCLASNQLSGANLRNSNLDKAILCKTQMPWGIDNAGCK